MKTDKVDVDVDHTTSSIVYRCRQIVIDKEIHLMVIHIDDSHDSNQHRVNDDVTAYPMMVSDIIG